MLFERTRKPVQFQPPICARCKHSFKSDQDNFGTGSHPKGRAPCAGTAGSINCKAAKLSQSVGILTIHASNQQCEWKELSSMGVSTKLQRNACLFGDWEVIRRVNEENTGHAMIQRSLHQNRPEFLDIQ